MEKIIDRLENIIIKEDLACSIGNFDGLHLGHQNLLNELKKETKYKRAIITFFPHPKFLLDSNYSTLISNEEKISLLLEYKVEYLIILKIDLDFLNMDKKDFIYYLKRNLNVKKIIVGEDFCFGKNNSGNIIDLKKEFIVRSSKLILVNNLNKISSTYLKDLLRNANIKEVNRLLNRPYHFKSKVINGNKIGRTLGFPTANLLINSLYLPKNGVYFVIIVYNCSKYRGILNIGYNPTINLQSKKRVEVHLLNFNDNIYNKELDVYFIEFLRDEKKFKNKEELILQIETDKERAKNYEISNCNCSK